MGFRTVKAKLHVFAYLAWILVMVYQMHNTLETHECFTTQFPQYDPVLNDAKLTFSKSAIDMI